VGQASSLSADVRLFAYIDRLEACPTLKRFKYIPQNPWINPLLKALNFAPFESGRLFRHLVFQLFPNDSFSNPWKKKSPVFQGLENRGITAP